MKKLSRVFFLLVWVLLQSAIAFAGGMQEGSSATAVSGEPMDSTAYSGKLVIWAWSESEVTSLAKAFNVPYPNVEVEFVPVGSGEYLAKFQAALVSKSDLPDVAFMEIGARGKMIDLDCWENLSGPPYNVDRKIFFENLLSTMENSRGEIVGIERELNPSGMSFKRDLVKKWLGTDDPDKIAAMFPDWESFIKKGQEIQKESGGEVKMLAGLDDASRILIRQYDKPVFVGDKAQASQFFNSLFSVLVKMRDSKVAGKLVTYSPSWNASFHEKQVMFYPSAPWSAQWIIKPNDPDGTGNWGVTRAPGGSYSYGGTAYAIPMGAKRKDLAWEFIKWNTTTPEGAKTAIDVIGAITSLKAMYANGVIPYSDPYFGGQDVNKFLIETVAPEMKIRPLSPYDPVLSDVVALVFKMLDSDPSIRTSKAVDLALKELSFKLPATMKIE